MVFLAIFCLLALSYSQTTQFIDFSITLRQTIQFIEFIITVVNVFCYGDVFERQTLPLGIWKNNETQKLLFKQNFELGEVSFQQIPDSFSSWTVSNVDRQGLLLRDAKYSLNNIGTKMVMPIRLLLMAETCVKVSKVPSNTQDNAWEHRLQACCVWRNGHHACQSTNLHESKSNRQVQV